MRYWPLPSSLRAAFGLTWRSLAALGLPLLIGTPASAQTIVYTDPADIILQQGTEAGSQSVTVSLDKSGVVDVFFNTHLGGGVRTLTASATSPSRIVASGSVATPLDSTATIGPSLAGGQAYALGGGFLRSSFGSGDTGPWPENVDRYVGVRMVRKPSPFETYTYYGWVRVSLEMTNASTHLTIKDWAYNNTPDAAITAGDTGIKDSDPPWGPSTVPEPSSLLLFAVGLVAVAALRARIRIPSD